MSGEAGRSNQPEIECLLKNVREYSRKNVRERMFENVRVRERKFENVRERMFENVRERMFENVREGERRVRAEGSPCPGRRGEATSLNRMFAGIYIVHSDHFLARQISK